jgi:hypothetical protein
MLLSSAPASKFHGLTKSINPTSGIFGDSESTSSNAASACPAVNLQQAAAKSGKRKLNPSVKASSDGKHAYLAMLPHKYIIPKNLLGAPPPKMRKTETSVEATVDPKTAYVTNAYGQINEPGIVQPGHSKGSLSDAITVHYNFPKNLAPSSMKSTNVLDVDNNLDGTYAAYNMSTTGSASLCAQKTVSMYLSGTKSCVDSKGNPIDCCKDEAGNPIPCQNAISMYSDKRGGLFPYNDSNGNPVFGDCLCVALQSGSPAYLDMKNGAFSQVIFTAKNILCSFMTTEQGFVIPKQPSAGHYIEITVGMLIVVVFAFMLIRFVPKSKK